MRDFMSGVPARDYVFQKKPYEEQVQKATELIEDADYILFGLGAGMSTAAGAQYGGEFFKKNFGEFIEKYGAGPYMQDMYSAGFYPYPDEESYWGYWSRQAIVGGIELDVTPLYRQLIALAEGKQSFCLSTNADGQMEKAGYPSEQIFCTQGDYFHIQCAKGCHAKIYDARARFHQMDQARRDCKVPSYMVPKCPVCGGKMNMNLRIDQYFVEDGDWEIADTRFRDFLQEALQSGKRICLIDCGTGFNTPMIIRFPFEKMVRNYKQCSMVRLNLNEAVVQESCMDREVGINADMAKSIPDILKILRKSSQASDYK